MEPKAWEATFLVTIQRQDRNIDAEAIEAPRDPSDDQFARESRAFSALLPDLLQSLPGRFVAVRNGKVIDDDADEFALAERVERRHRSDFVLIRRVSLDVVEDRLQSPEGEDS